MTENRIYRATVSASSRELTAREKLLFSDTSHMTRLDTAIDNNDNKLQFQPAEWVVLHVENEKADGDKEYYNYIILTEDGVIYYTGSQSFWNSFMEIYETMQGEDEDYEVVAYKVDSKNRQGQQFINCSIV